MRQYWTLFVFGVLIFFLPFLGFPPSWKTVFLFIAGIYVASFAFLQILRKRKENQSYITHQAHVPHENNK